MITIITSLFNGREFIEVYLKYITKCKEYNKCEHLIFNIKSSNDDFVEKILAFYKKKFNNINIIELEEDIGLYNIWNEGIRIAKHDLLTTSNIDDMLMEDFLVENIKYMEMNKHINLVTSIPKIKLSKIISNHDNTNIVWFNQKQLFFEKDKIDTFNIETGTKIKNLYYERYPDIKYNKNLINYLNKKKYNLLEIETKNIDLIWVSYDYFDKYDMFEIKDDNFYQNNIPHSSPVWRKKLHKLYGLFEEKKYGKYSDYEFWLRCLDKELVFGLINKNLYYYYYNSDSYSNKSSKLYDKLIVNNIISKYIY
jgi:hypothetical protein